MMLVLQSLSLSLNGVQLALNFSSALHPIPSVTKTAIGYYVRSQFSFFKSSFVRYGNNGQVISPTMPHKEKYLRGKEINPTQ